MCVLSAVLLLSNEWCHAQNCPGNDGVTINPASEETLDPAYQPYPSPSPAILKRYRFVPPGTWPQNKKFPTVLMVPPNIFKNDMVIDSGEPNERHASYSLQFAGFLVFQVETRLAPPGTLDGQSDTDKGYAPEQTDDLKRQILAAINDPQCNGEIFLVGGSAGGTLALWVALDAASTVSGWDETARAHIKAVVSLSGPAQFCDWSNPGNIPDTALTNFENDLDNYVNLPPQTNCDPDCDWTGNCALDEASPAWLVSHGATSNPPAFLLYSTTGDHVPYSQSADMRDALRSQFPSLPIDRWLMTYDYGSTHDHAFKYWNAINNDPLSDGLCVSEEVINFLQSHETATH